MIAVTGALYGPVAEARALAVVRDHVRERGYPPTLREVNAALGVAESNGGGRACLLVQALVRKGMLARGMGPRSITLALGARRTEAAP